MKNKMLKAENKALSYPGGQSFTSHFQAAHDLYQNYLFLAVAKDVRSLGCTNLQVYLWKFLDSEAQTYAFLPLNALTQSGNLSYCQ